MRIDKFLSNLKYGSRSEIKDFLKNHEVVIDGVRVFSVAFDIDPQKDIIYLDREPVFYK